MALFLISCESEIIRKQEEQIREQQEEITRQRKEIEEIKLARQKQEQQRQDCNRAFRDFENAQAKKNPDEAVALYRQGLKLCPDDDVAHYELGKILARAGKAQEAEQEFEAAIRINPNFTDARRQLETLRKR
ncbi:MAG: tetratricopeptide repeat protein [Deltaproteobacteria bacterium]|nr:tetratricopeptide repeat protein [Deltaproteobacteria bacterium]